MSGIATKAHLIEAAKRVAEDPSDARICDLLAAADNLLIKEMPKAYLNSFWGPFSLDDPTADWDDLAMNAERRRS